MGTANQIEQELMNYISDHKIRNTHSHHLPEQAMVDFDLDKLINNTYLQWQQVTPGTTAESRNAYLEKTRYKSYFVWLQKGNRGVVWNIGADHSSELGSDFRSDQKSASKSRLLHGCTEK